MNHSSQTDNKPKPPPTSPYDPLDPDQNPESIPLPPDTNPEPAPVREPEPAQPIIDPQPVEPTRLVNFCTTACQPVVRVGDDFS
jgi:hypothetical protein